MAKKTFLCFCFTLIISYINSELRFAFEIFRHGARTPYNELTPDEFKDWFGEKWPGIKELTSIGLRQHYLLGIRNHQRYIEDNKLLSKAFDPREIYVISTDTNRTLLSASAQLQGLYKAGDGPLLTPEQIDLAVPPNNIESYKEEKEALVNKALPNAINLVPIHTFFMKDRNFQLQDKKYCSGMKPYYKKNEEQQVVKDFLALLNTKHSAICSKLVRGDNCFNNYTFTYSVLDAIIAEYTDDRDMTNIIPNYDQDKIDDLFKDAMKFFDYDFVGNGIDSDREIGLIAMTTTMRRIIDWMDLKIKNDLAGKKDYISYSIPRFVMYSAHDTSVGAFEAFMKAVFNTKVIYAPFAANAYLELNVKNGVTTPTEDDYYVEYYFGDQIQGLNGQEKMAYKEFKSFVQKNLKTDEEIAAFCLWDPPATKPFNYFIVLTAIFGVICFILIGFIVHLCLNKPMTSVTDDYNKIQS